MNRNLTLLSILLVSATLVGCNCNDDQSTVRAPSSQSPSNTATATATATAEAVADTSLFSTEDFDLPYIIDLIQQDVTTDDIIRIVNDPEYAITNVDVLPCTSNADGSRTCGDGNLDFILAVETQGSNSFTFDFQAYATAPENPDAEESTNVASVTITQDTATGTASVEAQYPQYASGYQDSYYRQDGLSLGEAYLLATLLSPRYRPYGYSYGIYGGYYHPRPAYVGSMGFRSHSRQTASSTRSSATTRTTRSVTPQRRPDTATASTRATQSQSRLASTRTTSRSGTLSGASGTGRSHTATTNAQRSQGGSAFGGTNANRTGTNAALTQEAARQNRPSASQAAGNSNRTTTPRTNRPSTANSNSNRSNRSARPSSSSRRRSTSFGGIRSSSSSRRRSLAEYKTDIVYLGSDMGTYVDALMSMDLSTWAYIDDPSTTYLGVIIDDVLTQSPELDGVVVHGDTIDLYGMASLNVAANQTQQDEIDALTTRMLQMEQAMRDGTFCDASGAR